jgi:hypothetical protein
MQEAADPVFPVAVVAGIAPKTVVEFLAKYLPLFGALFDALGSFPPLRP